MKILIRTVLLFTFFTLTASAVYSCTCDIMKPAKKLRKAKAVFIGEVVEIGTTDKSEWATAVAKFQVERYCKGVKERFVIVIGAPAAAGACGLRVEVGKKYLIYAFDMGDGEFETSFCASRAMEQATDDLAVIGKGKSLKLR